MKDERSSHQRIQELEDEVRKLTSIVYRLNNTVENLRDEMRDLNGEVHYLRYGNMA